MKRLSTHLLSLAILSVFVFASSFKTANNGNGNVVTIDNGQTWFWAPDNCYDAPWIPSTSARVQTATNGFFHLTVTFQLPEGHCDIPEKGANVTKYGPDSWSVVNSKGLVKAKIVIKPNGD